MAALKQNSSSPAPQQPANILADLATARRAFLAADYQAPKATATHDAIFGRFTWLEGAAS